MLSGLNQPQPSPPAPHPLPPSHRTRRLVAEQNGNSLHACWQDVLRCVSRFELLQQLTAGVPTDALLFAMPESRGGGDSAGDKLKKRFSRGAAAAKGGERDSIGSINDMGLHMPAGRGGGGKDGALPPAEVMGSVDVQELNRLFVDSGKLDRCAGSGGGGRAKGGRQGAGRGSWPR